MFVGLHALLADRTETPELAITEEEGKAFMDAAQNVMRHYSVETTQKALDWTAFAGVAAGMYMPRVAAIGMRKKAGRAPAQARKAGKANGTAPAQAVPIVPDMMGGAGFQGEA